MKKRGKVLTKIILSYSAMICIFIFISIVVYYYTYGIVEEQASAHNSNLLNVIQSSCDSELRYYKSFLEQLRVDETVQELERNPEHASAQDYWNDYLVRENLQKMSTDMQGSSNNCHDLFVWLKQQDKIINTDSSMSYEIYSSIVCLDKEEWASTLKQALTQMDIGNAIGLHSASKNYIVLLEPVLGVNIQRGSVVTGIWIDINALEQKINTIDWDGGIDWMLLDNQGNILRKPDQFDVTELNTAELLAMDGSNIHIGDRTYFTAIQESDFYDLKYVLLTPEAMVNSPATRIRMINFISLFVILVTGCVATAFFTKMHYHPLRSLLQMINDGKDKESIANEYEYLEKKVSGILQKNKDTENKNRSMARIYALEKLLLPQKLNKNTSESEEVYNKFRSGRNIVLICYVKETADSEEEKNEIIRENWLKRYIIRNVFEEGIGEYFRQETFEYGNKIITVMNIPKGCEDYLSILQGEIERLREFITKKFRFSFYTFEGGIHEGLEGVSQSWLEACQTEEFVSALDEMYIRYEEIRDMSVYRYAYSFDVEECIVNAIRNGDARLAQSTIDHILESSFGKSQNTVFEMQTCMLYDIFGTLVKASEEQGINISRMPKLNLISAETSEEVLKNYFREIIEDICVQIECEKGDKQGTEMSEEIMEYIRRTYADPDLNISKIAYQFHMTPAWISSTFKKQTGKSLLNVIKQIRIENAKKFLNEGYSVVEVSSMVGFRESTTFIRTFKGYTGVTPGQLKKVNKNESNRQN